MIIKYFFSKKRLIASLFLLILTFFSGSNLLAQKANVDSLFTELMDHNKIGMSLLSGGKRAEGVKEFNKSLDAYSDYDYWTANKRDSTFKIFESLEKKNPKSPVFKYILGSLTNLMKRDAEGQAKSLEYFKSAVKIEPGLGKGYSYLASLAAVNNNYDEALKYYYQAIKCDSSILSNFIRASYMLEKLNKNEEADNLLNDMIKKDSSNYASISGLIKLASKKSSFQEKYDLYFKAFRLAKDEDKEAPMQQIMYNLFKDAPDSSIAFSKRILKSNFGKNRTIKQGALQNIFDNMARSDKKSIPAFAEENYNLDNPRLMQSIGGYFEREAKDNNTALKYYLKGYEITNPKSVVDTYLFGGGSTFDEQAKKTAKRVKEGSFALAIGRLYYELKDYSNAEKYLREAIPENLNNKINNSTLYLGYTLAANGRKEEAIKWIAKGVAMKSDPDGEKKLKELIEDLKLNKTADDLVREERMKNSVPAKDFILNDLNGKPVQLSKLKGKVVMLDFWGTWCGPCVSELPQLVKLYDKYKDNPDVLFFGIDVNEQPAVIKKFMDEKKYSFNVLIADGSTTQKEYEVTAVPTKFLIDKEGRIQFSHIGSSVKEDVVEALSKEIDELLKMK